MLYHRIIIPSLHRFAQRRTRTIDCTTKTQDRTDHQGSTRTPSPSRSPYQRTAHAFSSSSYRDSCCHIFFVLTISLQMISFRYSIIHVLDEVSEMRREKRAKMRSNVVCVYLSSRFGVVLTWRQLSRSGDTRLLRRR